ncbi:MAG: alpha-glucosidase/alpha-galactosidase [Lentisphaeria bacterium]|nr:alpha-glucosidase/alpha-galactosidase [Lentisphaeria bacterium]
MIKVAVIGAGSVVFTKNLTGDILSYPEFKNAHFCYMDIDAQRLKVAEGLCRQIAKGLGVSPTIEGTLDQKKALDGADFVITTVQVGGFDSTLVDFDIPRKYGLHFTIADTTGPGGIFRALRTFPFFKQLMSDMESVCPKATLLNYSNPMSMNMLGISRISDIPAVGLCHSVQGTHSQLMRYLDEKPEETNFICAGINHMAFYQTLEKNGEDLYPRLFEAMNDPKVYNTNKVRFELMRRLGYYITESSEHNAEYCPYFIPHGPEEIRTYDIPIDEYLRRCDGIVDTFEKLIESSKEDKAIEHNKSHEYGSAIIHSISTNTPTVVYGNMPNNGAISNLPDNAIVEAPTLVDGNGLQFTNVGDLPTQLIGYMMPHVIQHELYVQAVLTGRRDHLYQACMNDPLTAASMPLDKIVEMVDEMIVCHGDLLPELKANPRGIPSSGIDFKATSAEEFRQRWEDRKPDDNDIILKDWEVSQVHDEESLKDSINVENLKLTGVQATIQGFVSFEEEQVKEGVQYFVTDLESVHQRETQIKLGCTDDVKVWLNGDKVIDFAGIREFKANENESDILIKEGWNKIVVAAKTNKRDSSGFAVTVPKADF